MSLDDSNKLTKNVGPTCINHPMFWLKFFTVCVWIKQVVYIRLILIFNGDFAFKQIFIYGKHRQCSVCGRCPVPGDHPSQAAFRWVSTWMGDRRTAACTSKLWAGGRFSETVRLGTDSVKWPTVSAQFPCALVQMRYNIGENGCGHILMGGNSGGKEGR